jgi:hypothetical protein
MKLSVLLLVSAVLWAVPDESKTSGKRARKAAEPAASRQTSITGCLDQRGEEYVIRSTDDMARVTAVKGKGFSNDNFARYIGQQVRVQGAASKGAASNDSTFEVTKIDKVADTCSH